MGEDDDLPSIKGRAPVLGLAEDEIRRAMFKPLLAACPSFQPTWDAFLEDWQDEPEDLPTYLALADLARHLIGMLERADTGSFPTIFAVVEGWQTNSSRYVREAAVVGLLEDLQNTNLHERGTTPEQFVPWLKPISLKWWRKVEAFWETGAPLVDD